MRILQTLGQYRQNAVISTVTPKTDSAVQTDLDASLWLLILNQCNEIRRNFAPNLGITKEDRTQKSCKVSGFCLFWFLISLIISFKI